MHAMTVVGRDGVLGPAGVGAADVNVRAVDDQDAVPNGINLRRNRSRRID